MPEKKMVKATLEIYAPPTGGQSGPGGLTDQIEFQFNPAELSLVKEVSWARHNARLAQHTSVPEFTGSRPRVLAMSVVLDAKDTKGKSVDARVSTLLGCCTPTEGSRFDDRPSPPWVRFRWGGFESVSFVAFLSGVKATYTRFSADGEPLRAVCEITLEEIGMTTAGQNPTSGSPSSRRSHVVVRGDSLPSVAFASTGSTQYRAIAELNGITDVSKIEPGQVLLLPGAADNH
ncbi:LysM peptidoglycan-binding domain-containing protein [Streptomyces sp. NPDC056149]|uniref:CIS tube protein n=1 Tax=unclassified Streptomyces TaxID=2593676 RepID=UPI00238158A3|nr:LysM peptidoglycan-binding domain-containing protein [Streptomyces sp. WZ-12]